MARKIVLYIAMSLDGYIAGEYGELDFLSELGEVDLGYDAFDARIDTVVMGSHTYMQVVNELSPDVWAYAGKNTLVATSQDLPEDENVEFVKDGIVARVLQEKQKAGKDIWLVGGGVLASEFIENDLVDEYIITVIPIIQGSGIPLFLGDHEPVDLHLQGTKQKKNLIELTYTKL
ncbi:MAG: dihydrofolate reductase family protein [Eubacteriales bacterium]